MVLDSVFIRTPASAGNVGPGHDCFGLAFNLYNDFQFTLHKGTNHVEILPQGFCLEQKLSSIPVDHDNLAIRSFHAACQHWNLHTSQSLHVTMTLGIPINRGLGSSATARVAGVLAARALLDTQKTISDQDVEILVSKLERHPDNALPCLHGGFVISVENEESVESVPILPPASPALALCVPKNLEISTTDARRALPDSVSKEAAVYSASRAAVLATAFSSGQYQILGRGNVLSDRLHEPYRGPLIPGFEDARRGAREAGAYGLVISGSGPTLLIIAKDPETAQSAGERVAELWAALDIQSWIQLSSIPSDGAFASVSRLTS